MPIVGISLDALLTLVIGPPVTILVILLLVYVGWVPKPAKTYIKAKILKLGVDINANNIGGLQFRAGKMKGPGVFQFGKRGEMNVVPRIGEGWAAKVFNADGIPTLFSCSDKAVSANPTLLATLGLNNYIAGLKKLDKYKDKNESEIYDALIAENPDAKELLESFTKNHANVPHKKKGVTEFIREVAVLLDPRDLKEYVKWNITPGQLLAVDQMAYNDGFEEGQKPLLHRALPLIALLALMVVGVALAMALG